MAVSCFAAVPDTCARLAQNVSRIAPKQALQTGQGRQMPCFVAVVYATIQRQGTLQLAVGFQEMPMYPHMAAARTPRSHAHLVQWTRYTWTVQTACLAVTAATVTRETA